MVACLSSNPVFKCLWEHLQKRVRETGRKTSLHQLLCRFGFPDGFSIPARKQEVRAVALQFLSEHIQRIVVDVRNAMSPLRFLFSDVCQVAVQQGHQH